MNTAHSEPPAPGGNLASDRVDAQFREVVVTLGPALERMAHGYEFDSDRRRDLVQEILVAIWRSLAGFNGACSLRTWAYRVAHNVAASHVIRDRRDRLRQCVPLEGLEDPPAPVDVESDLDRAHAIERLHALIARLVPLDRQLLLLYLEGVDVAEIADVTGLTPGNVATKIHRIKRVLAQRFARRSNDAG